MAFRRTSASAPAAINVALVFAGCFVVARALPAQCSNSTIPHSNRQEKAPCNGHEGHECIYTCDPGYQHVGRHVCQSYRTREGHVAIDHSFFGGRCQRLCGGRAAQQCKEAGDVPVRWNSSDSDGPCLVTQCFQPDDALRRLARGAYGLWRLGRSSDTGIYSGYTVPAAAASSQSEKAHIGANGLGLISECIAAEMGWVDLEAAARRVKLTMSALAGELPGFNLSRSARGWIPTFFSKRNGSSSLQIYSVLDTGLSTAGALLAKRYFLHRLPGASVTKEVAALADSLVDAVHFEDLLCNEEGQVDPHGTGIPFTFTENGTCVGLSFPRSDGYYGFHEGHNAVWLAYMRACAGAKKGACGNPGIEAMWRAWQGRRSHPDTFYRGQPLVSTWPSYIVHLPFYASYSFNADEEWRALFKSMWEADRTYFNSSAYYAGEEGRYGLAAGYTQDWCSLRNASYEADIMDTNATTEDGAQGCRMYSPYAVAGYLPAEPDVIKGQLLSLLASGEAVFPMPGTGDGVSQDFVLLRKSLLDPSWTQEKVSMVDFSSELFGLSTIWLGVGFFDRYTDHWDEFAARGEAAAQTFLSRRKHSRVSPT